MDPDSEGVTILNCVQCEYITQDAFNMKRHNRSVHLKEKSFYCNQCEFTSFDSIDVEYHIKQEHYEIKQKWNTQNYITKGHRKKILKCRYCPNKYTLKRYLKNHERISHKNSFELQNINKLEILFCEQCKYETKKKQTLSIHVRSLHDKEVRYHCSECDFKAFHNKSITLHIEGKHQDSGARTLKIFCIYCNSGKKHTQCNSKIKAEPRIRLRKKQKIRFVAKKEKTMDVQFSCNLCDKTFTNNKYLKCHTEVSHGVSGKEPYSAGDFKHVFKCEDCEFETGRRGQLNIHVKSIHKKEVKFACSLCGYKSFFNHQVRSHIDTKHKSEDVRSLKIGCLPCKEEIAHTTCELETKVKHKLIDTKKTKKTKRKRKHNNETKVQDTSEISCTKCSFFTNSRITFKQHHESIHENMLRYSCSGCDLKSYWKSEVAEHIARLHTDGNAHVIGINCYKCVDGTEHEICTFTERKAIKSISHPKVKLECKFCSFIELDGFHQLMLKHYKKEHPKYKLFTCNLCHYKTNYMINLKGHKESKHEESIFPCDQCDFKSKWKTSLSEHRRTVHQIFKYKTQGNMKSKELLCDKCGFGSMSEKLMENHTMTQCKKISIDSFPCNVCDKVSSTATALYRHMVRTHTKKLQTCAQCGFIAKSTFFLNTHQYEMHEQVLPNCRFCGIKTRNKISLQIHIQRKHPKGGLKCVSCNYEAPNIMALKQHKENNHDGIRYSCSHCAYVGPNKALLKKHKMKHHVHNNFKCNDCAFIAHTLNSLNSHNRDNHSDVNVSAVKVTTSEMLEEKN